MNYPTIDGTIGNTRLVRLQRLSGTTSNVILAKMEGDNPASSVKDRAAITMIKNAAARGEIVPGQRLVEATSGNTGIALAMAAAMMGYHMTLVMPVNASFERKAAMLAYGAELIEVSESEGMEGARDLAAHMQRAGKGIVLDQFNNPDNALAHYRTTGPEIWRDTGGEVTHVVSSMGTTGTIMGISKYLKEQNSAIQMIGLQPAVGACITGIRRWQKSYMPAIYDATRVDRVVDVSQVDAEHTMRQLAEQEGIFCGPSAGGAVHQALALSREVQYAVIVAIICDRGDRYLSTDIFGKKKSREQPFEVASVVETMLD